MDFLCILQLQPQYKLKANWTDATNKIRGHHWNYLVQLHGEGKIKFVSRTSYDIDNDNNRGYAVYVADTEQQARDLMMNDPSIVNGLMTGELHALTVFMLGDKILVH
jgi:uncharacterized protein YciI